MSRSPPWPGRIAGRAFFLGGGFVSFLMPTVATLL